MFIGLCLRARIANPRYRVLCLRARIANPRYRVFAFVLLCYVFMFAGMDLKFALSGLK